VVKCVFDGTASWDHPRVWDTHALMRWGNHPGAGSVRARGAPFQRASRPSRLVVRGAASRPNKAMALTTEQVSSPNFKWSPEPSLKSKALLGSREEYDAMYMESIENPNGFWSKVANQFHW